MITFFRKLFGCKFKVGDYVVPIYNNNITSFLSIKKVSKVQFIVKHWWIQFENGNGENHFPKYYKKVKGLK